MKNRNPIIILIFMFYTSEVFGQTDKINIGLEFGPSLTSLKGNEILEKFNDATLGFSVGPTLQYNFTNLISIRTNIAFERKGAIAKGQAADEFGNLGGEIKTHINFDFLTIPLLTKLTFGNTTKFFADIGPSLGYLIKQTTVTDSFGQYPKKTIDETDLFKKIDIGLIYGIGAERPINEWLSLSIEVRNNRGLNNISKRGVVNDGSIKTNSFNFLVGASYKFRNN
jgi:hypothetical protein